MEEPNISWLYDNSQSYVRGLKVRLELLTDYAFRPGKYIWPSKALERSIPSYFPLRRVADSWLLDTSGLLGRDMKYAPPWFVRAELPVAPRVILDHGACDPETVYTRVFIEIDIFMEDMSKSNKFEYDAFIVHASEDKEGFVRPLATQLRAAGHAIWYDEFEITLGDSIRESIDRGLRKSRFGIIVLSENSMKKQWPKREYGALFARETKDGKKVILPVWLETTSTDVEAFSDLIMDKKACVVKDRSHIGNVVQEISEYLRQSKHT